MSSKHLSTIAIVIGTRAELIKTFPIMIELHKRKVPYVFIHTGQHNLKDLCKKFSVKIPDVILTKEPTKSSKFNTKKTKALLWNLRLIRKIKKELKKLPNLKYVLYHGDTMTTASAALASSKLLNPFKTYKNVHLESGLRSWNNLEPFPEELSRKIATRFSDILFAPSKDAAYNLRKLKKKKILVLGNTIVDSTHYALSLAKKKKRTPLNRARFGLVTVHRHENLTKKKNLKKIIDILISTPLPLYFMIHDNTLHKLEKSDLLTPLKRAKHIHLIKPKDYIDFIYQYSKCCLVICDGGSMQEESLILKKPCILLRNTTERPEGLKTNFQFLSKLNKKKTQEKIKEFLSSKFTIKPFKNPYGKKGLTKKIVDILVR